MKNRLAAAGTALLLGALVLLGAGGYAVKAQGEEDFRIEGTVLTAYIGTDTFVSIPDYVTVIAEGAFAENTTLQRVELPQGLTRIEYNAFGDCSSLASAVLPDSVVRVGPGAFKGCTALTLVEIGPNVRSWGSGVFNDCTSLSSLFLDEKNPYLTYYNGALYNGDMSMLYQVLSARAGENYVMPEEVKSIDTYAFWNLQNTQNVMVSEKVSTISAFSMSSMGSVQNVVLPDSVTNLSEKAFSNNSSLQQVMLPSNVSQIHSTAFANSPNVKILTTQNSIADSYGKEHNIPVIYQAELATDFNDSNPSGQEKPIRKVTAVQTPSNTDTEETQEQEETQEESSSADTYADPLAEEEGVLAKTKIVNGQAVILVGRDQQKVYGSPAQSETTTQPETATQSETATQPETATQSEPASQSETATETEQETTTQTDTKTESDTSEPASDNQSIKQREYYKQNDLTNYEISEKIKVIERLAFARSGLQEITIPDSVTTIEYGAFYACEDLEKVTISDSVTSIGSKAFADTPWLTQWLTQEDTSEGDFLIVGDGILLAYRGTGRQVEIPEGVKQIASETFRDHTEITSVSIPDSVTAVGADAFRDCSSLSELTGGRNIRTITRGAFYGTEISEEDL